MAAIEVSRLIHQYGSRRALDEVNLEVTEGEIFGFLGPNGGGKTTLFRLLSTLIPIQSGTVRILGWDLPQQAAAVRQRIGVVFQAPSLDKKLTVQENLLHRGHLYGLSGARLKLRQSAMLDQLGLADRAADLVETLSGGLRRRVELAAGMLHQPRLLLLDEPSTGLDPGARGDLWDYLERIRAEQGITIVLTTHLLEEADRADRLAILHQGQIVAQDTPDRLRATVGGDTLTIVSDQPSSLAAAISEKFHLTAQVVGQQARLELPDAHQWVARLVEAFPGQIQAVTLGKPTLEDVFIARTGHRFWSERGDANGDTVTKKTTARAGASHG